MSKRNCFTDNNWALYYLFTQIWLWIITAKSTGSQVSRLSLIVIDSSITYPKVDSYNKIVDQCHYPWTYHLPLISDTDSILKSLSRSCVIIILGSAASVNDQSDWQLVLSCILNKAIAKKGDLLFFRTEDHITHVGISMGGDKFIHQRIKLEEKVDIHYL